MPRTVNSSSLRRTSAAHRLLRVSLKRLRAHPANPNLMDEPLLAKLAANIRREGRYPPLIVRPMPGEADCYQVLDGHQRWRVLERLGHRTADCYAWPCDDETALFLLATLNRLAGQDDPLKRAELLRALSDLVSIDQLAQLLPEDAGEIRRSLDLIDLDLEGLLADLVAGAGQGSEGLHAISFAVSSEDERLIEDAIARATQTFDGKNRRGRALAELARVYLKGLRR